ncbi:extracellular solute-binding protein [Paenibacillus doosanensis]|uniref:Multiple sugar-binding protein n=1 Tax=Paenibacillus konkukensis TaxID=2020716 RepID=A0ABY4RIE0_9BACL|nr:MULTISPECIES: extracellular solute-binding protein [Paenibacillus]MCS7463821.1 extracellular solute-binding protein [Paenibacillus doosanensis]UQZ81374.1 Multiple sugar-binding protein precursor [Paenibacillus konkukensis]
MKRKALFASSALLLLSSVISACSSGSGTGSKDTGSAAGGEVAKSGGDPVKLVMYSWRPEDKDGYAKIIAEFEKDNPNIKVEFKPYKSTEYNTIVTNSLQSGTGVDIVQLRPYDGAKALADANYLTPLDNIKGLTNIPASYLDAAKGSDNKVYGVPIMLNNAVIFYNKKLFDANGLQPPETWDEFVKTCEALKAKNIIPIAQSGKAAYLLSTTHAVIGPNAYGGTDYMQAVLKGTTNFKDPKFVESIKRMKQLEAYFPKDFIAIEDKDAQGLFYTEKAAMYINGSQRLETFEANKVSFPVEFLPGLSEKKGDPAQIATWVDGSYGIAKSSKHQEEAAKFMEFVASPKFGQMFSDELTRVSPINGVAPKNEQLKKMAAFSEKHSTPYLLLTSFSQGTPTTKTTFEDSLQGMYIGKLTPEQVAADTQASADKWFKPQK